MESKLKYGFIVLLGFVIIGVVAGVLVYIYNDSAYPKNGLKLLIDQDGGADDAMAIFMALLYEENFNGPEVIGITTGHGNVYEDQCYINLQRVLNVAEGFDIPIYRGVNNSIIKTIPPDYYFGKDGLGDNENISYKDIPAENINAVDALIQLSKEYEGELVIVALGPLTNIALAIRMDPGLIGRLHHLYVGSGIVQSEAFPEPEFNAMGDVEAYFITVENANTDKVTLLPFSQLANFNISKSWRTDVLGSIPTKIMKAMNGFENVSLSNSGDKWLELDPVTMAVVLRPDIVVETRQSMNGIHLCGPERGLNTNDFSDPNATNTNLIFEANQSAYQEFLLKVFTEEEESDCILCIT